MFTNFEFGFDLPTGIVITAFIAAFASVLAVALPFLNRSDFAARRRAVVNKREELAVAQREGFQQRRRLQPGRSEGWMRAVIKQLKLQDMLEAKDLKRRLVQAGWRSNSAPVTFIFMRIATPLLLGGVAAFYAWTIFADWVFLKKLLVVAVTILFGFVLPSIFLTNAVQKRQKIVTRAFPDALDLMVICVESGMSIEAAFNKVAEEMAESA
ncbi:MAG TPA: type II secretion system F family protein, partial [Dongiaceae bacterium]